jgi:hypothetical protein
VPALKPEWSTMFEGSIESLDQRNKEANKHLEAVISNRDVPSDAMVLLSDLHYVNRFQLLLIKRLLIELDDVVFDFKQLQKAQKK